LKHKGYKVLIIDMDPQGNLSFCANAETVLSATIYEVLKGEVKLQHAIQRTAIIDIVAANILLSGIEMEYTQSGREFLLRNALHYTEQGTVRLVLETGGFRVEDSGPGIAPEQQERIFQPFVRGTQARGEGLGLGLSLVKRICAKQGWTISLHSPAGGGSCFRLSFIKPA
jgi:K+-sensing histidine kinase KdpD